MNTKNNILWIDVLKGISIILVVFGHNTITGTKMFNYIYSFHMPLFFFVSGYLFLSEKYPSWYKFIKKRFKQLIVPYISLAIISIPFYILNQTESTNIIKDFLLSKRTHMPFNEPLWFLTCLFIVEAIYFLIRKYIRKEYLIIIILLIFGYVGYKTINSPKLPWTLDSALYYILFYGFGSIIRELIVRKKKILQLKNIIYAISVTISIMINISIYYLAPDIYDFMFKKDFFKTTLLSPYMKSIIISFAGIITYIYIAKVSSNSKVLRFLGRNSLVILGLHIPLRDFFVYKLLVYYKVNISTQYYTLGIFYTIVTLAICLPCIYVINKYAPIIIAKEDNTQII